MLDVSEIKSEALRLINAGVRGQHSNNRVIRLCEEVERLESALAQTKAEFDAAGVILRAYDAELVKWGIVVEIGVGEPWKQQ
jgi:uncharacterized small protein (DUF1192 family)